MLRINPSDFSQRLADSIAEFHFVFKKCALRVQKMSTEELFNIILRDSAIYFA